MARSKSPPALLHGPDRVGQTPPDMAEQQARIRCAEDIAKDIAEDTFAIGVEIGRFDGMDFFANLANYSMVCIFEKVKKSKAWMHLRNPENCQNAKFESLEEFCQVKLGRSYRRLQALTANRNLLGQDSYEQAERLGLRQADYDLLKSLPQPKQEIIKSALAEGATREELQKALRELAAVDQQEITALKKGLSEVEQNNAALSKNLAEKKADLDSMHVKYNEARRHIHALPPDESSTELRDEFMRMILGAEATIRCLASGCEALIAHAANNDGISHDDFLAATFGMLDSALTDVRLAYNIKDHPGNEALRYVLPEVAAATALAQERRQSNSGSARDGEAD